jgi:predicted ATPase
MLNLEIENFKCFTHKTIPINRLTVLAGANGNGKSTVIQALLFLRRTIEHCAKWEGGIVNKYEYNETNGLNVELNGSYCLALGNSFLITPRDTSPEFVAITFNYPKEYFQVVYEIDDNINLHLKPIKVTNTIESFDSIFIQEFYYLNAERMGPRINQGIKFYDFPNAGFQGEFVAQLISDTNSNYTFEIEDSRKNVNSKSPRLEQQVNVWLNELMPGVSVSASYSPDTHSAQIKVDNYYTKGDPTIATNIGFGISYVLPILVTGLIAKKGSFMIVENPEAHLHPSAQSKIGRFLAMVANSGVNVIVETHSDHFVNGIQIATALKEVDKDLVTINYFSQEEYNNQPNVESISINEKGELSSWPKGFFDQTQIDFAELFKIRRG